MPETMIQRDIKIKFQETDEWNDPKWWCNMKGWIEPFRKLLMLKRMQINKKIENLWLDINFRVNHRLIRKMFTQQEFRSDHDKKIAQIGNITIVQKLKCCHLLIFVALTNMLRNNFYSRNQQYDFMGLIDWNLLKTLVGDKPKQNSDWKAFDNICPTVVALKDCDVFWNVEAMEMIRKKIRNMNKNLFIDEILQSHLFRENPEKSIDDDWVAFNLMTVCLNVVTKSHHDM